MALGLISSPTFASTAKRARIIVSLADNKNQSIVPIKPSLGNGQKPSQNLYWGALYGVKTHFKKMEDWSVKDRKPGNKFILDSVRLIHDQHPNVRIDVEAWDGAKQNRAVQSYLTELRNADSAAGLVGFIGHNALMDVSIPNLPVLPQVREKNVALGRKGIVIACSSASYFDNHHNSLGVNSYVMTKGSMAPEAYVLQGILEAWLIGSNSNTARAQAARQYAKYQKIPLRNANWLFGVKS